MNTINYATLEQAKKMKELGYPQDKTDCVWIKIFSSGFTLEPVSKLSNLYLFEWYAAPNAQEIELNLNKVYCEQCLIETEELNNAQARANAWIWEKENKNV